MCALATPGTILESVVADGRFPADKVVVDASRYARHKQRCRIGIVAETRDSTGGTQNG